ncbi:MAG: cytoplasmic tRNA 2-thiolation protein 2 [Candelina submexicana]|nr:MAG: cytoplasmic tRNA 2-thiolation protein 2 [Candelina submexicana]
MPGKHNDGIQNGELRLCKRCQVLEASVLVRMEHLCRDCFMTYVRTKVVKRMDSYRVRDSKVEKQRVLLLPLSFGASSVSLLHILDYQLQTQIDRAKRAGYVLHVVVVEARDLSETLLCKAKLAEIQRRYPRHTYSTLALADIFDFNHIIDLDIYSIDSAQLGDQSRAFSSKEEKLDALLSSLPSTTSKFDVLCTLRTRLIIEFAKQKGCEGIFWGDSTTRLAEKTLAETAKGRGFSLPWQIADGASPHDLNFKYPLRDLLRKELVTFSELTSPPLTALIFSQPQTARLSASAKSTTIDNLMSQYFESVEENYPSIVANVVRTSSKLRIPSNSRTDQRCKLCGLPVPEGAMGIHGWGGDQKATVDQIDPETTRRQVQELCYGCARSALGTT